jgi:predicted AAA+ superfamily ATPase
MINRNLTSKIIKALNNFRIVSINGPRQSGKTTLVKFIADQKAMNYITFDDQQKLNLALEDPKNFIKYYAKKPIVIDEVQLVPQIIPEIKTLVDEQNHKGMFLLTGSADILKMQKVTESLAGRIVRYNLYPLLNAEIQTKKNNLIDQLFQDNFFDIDLPSCQFELEEILAFIIRGGYPEILSIDEEFRNDWFDSYIESRIQKDIIQMRQINVNRLLQIRKLLQILATHTSSLLNYNTIANKLQIDNKTVAAYIEILEAMYIIKIIPSYFVNLSLRVIKSPKIQFIDTGLVSSLLNLNIKNLFENKNGIYGSIIENYVYAELLKFSTYSKQSINIYHFRDLKKHEVDLVLENRDGQIIGIEIKAKSIIKKSDLKPMIELANHSKSRFLRGFIFYSGKEIMPYFIDNYEIYLFPIGNL